MFNHNNPNGIKIKMAYNELEWERFKIYAKRNYQKPICLHYCFWFALLLACLVGFLFQYGLCDKLICACDRKSQLRTGFQMILSNCVLLWKIPFCINQPISGWLCYPNRISKCRRKRNMVFTHLMSKIVNACKISTITA